jgi:hypothetical protein
MACAAFYAVSVMTDRFALQRAVLQLLAEPRTDCRLGRGNHYLSEAIRAKFPAQPPSASDLHQSFWSLVAQGLAYIDMSQSAAENWTLNLTPAGVAAVHDEDYNPDDASGYLARLAKDVPGLSNTTIMYVREAVRSYAARNYLATTVMLGVASEAAMLEMAEHLAQHYEDVSLQSVLDDERTPYNRKFAEVRKRLDQRKQDLPRELADGMSLTFDSVLDLLRVNRNDAGHPTGRHFDRDDCYIALRMAIRYLKKIGALTIFFGEANTPK